MECRSLNCDELANAYVCMQASPEKGEVLQKSIAFLKGKLEQGWSAYAVFSEGKPVGKAIVSAPNDSPFPITGDGIYVLHCIYITPRLSNQGYGSRLLQHLENEIHEKKDAKGIAVLSYGDFWMPSAFFLRYGYEFVNRDSLASLLLKRFDVHATVSFRPAHPIKDIPPGKVRIDINYDPTCPFTTHNYMQVKVFASHYGDKLDVNENFIDSPQKWQQHGEANVYINNRALPAGPISERHFRREVDALLAKL